MTILDSWGVGTTFDAADIGRIKIKFEDGFFDRVWKLAGLRIEGYSGQHLRFIFEHGISV